MIRIVRFSFLLVGLFGCVSIGLNDSKIVRSKKVKYSSPPLPYVETAPDHLDKLWKSRANGNSISFLSDCADRSDVELDTLTENILRAVNKVKIQSADTIEYNDREALYTKAAGKVDGVDTQVHIVVFKKNGCTYVLNFAGLARTLGEDLRIFTDFMKSFKAP